MPSASSDLETGEAAMSISAMGRPAEGTDLRNLFLAGIFAMTVAASLMGVIPPAVAMDKYIALGAGMQAGVSHEAGLNLCDGINSGRHGHGVRCRTYATGGSIFNINALRSGEMDVVITRADLAYEAYRGEGAFGEDGPFPQIRAIATVYDSPMVILVPAFSDIETLEDLRGRRVNVGNPGSGERAFARLVFDLADWNDSDFEMVHELPRDAAGDAFCNGAVDAVFQALPVPSEFYDRLTQECDARFLTLTAQELVDVLNSGPFFEVATIPGDVFPWNSDDIVTVSTEVVLVSSTQLHDATVSVLAQSLHALEMEEARTRYSRARRSETKDLVEAGDVLPLHAGAVEYFRAAGIEFGTGRTSVSGWWE
ncbi:MAG: TAXI family TRAP transporter solute-binding subunit [Alphaproteobacteria bacterium]|nr:TAXI family TRAP transporter solute-binding subunit [Alphaproteobacteria bacterium]